LETITIKGNPIPLARPRFGKGHVYDSQKNEREAYCWEIRMQRIKYRVDGAIRLTLIFEMAIPKGKKGLVGKLHCKRPDLSNLIKFVEDSALGVLYKDDNLIAEIVAKKIYSLEPKTTIIIEELEVG
jgi:Holliday junction resolvase RusA-like endonuclease